MVRYRFSEFTLSPQRRLLLRAGQEVPLIPRYFDLLLLLVERRGEAVHRREIFERVWADAIVSESALSQAIRTIRRTLDDDSREPRFIRTVSRHGYRFVFPDVVEEEEEDASVGPRAPVATAPPAEGHSPWLAGIAGATLAGIVTGVAGGLVLVAAPGSTAPFVIVPVLAVIGAACGAVGGAGVVGGLMIVSRTGGRADHIGALTVGAALGGALVGAAVQWLTRWGLAALVGLDLDVGGSLAGLAIGAAAGLAFGLVRRQAPIVAALVAAVLCGAAGLALALAGHPLAAGTIHALADAAEGSRATLEPLARLVGERDFGPVSGGIFAFVEGAMFGFGLLFGLIRSSHRNIT